MEFRHMSKDSIIYIRPTIPIATSSKLFRFYEIVNTVLNYNPWVLNYIWRVLSFWRRSFGSLKLLFKCVYLNLAQIPSHLVVTSVIKHPTHASTIWSSSGFLPCRDHQCRESLPAAAMARVLYQRDFDPRLPLAGQWRGACGGVTTPAPLCTWSLHPATTIASQWGLVEWSTRSEVIVRAAISLDSNSRLQRGIKSWVWRKFLEYHIDCVLLLEY